MVRPCPLSHDVTRPYALALGPKRSASCFWPRKWPCNGEARSYTALRYRSKPVWSLRLSTTVTVSACRAWRALIAVERAGSAGGVPPAIRTMPAAGAVRSGLAAGLALGACTDDAITWMCAGDGGAGVVCCWIVAWASGARQNIHRATPASTAPMFHHERLIQPGFVVRVPRALSSLMSSPREPACRRGEATPERVTSGI